ncbi:MAG TPA: hypothetical protein VMG38_15115 [Trebonia sp.]|nr:hypothetical protein [Trebonia sp.]
MKNSRLLTIVGTVTVIAGSSAAVAGPRPALAGTTACGSTGVAGLSSCTYSTVGTDTFTVPPGVRSATFTVEGAQGGASAAGAAGGRGGKVSAVLPVTPGQSLQVNVGGQGQASSASGGPDNGAGGGGSSDVRGGLSGLASRLLVAGGGGGAGGSRGTTDAHDVGGAGGWGGGGGGAAGAPHGAQAGRGASASSYGAGGTGMNGWSGAPGGIYSGGIGASPLPIAVPGGGGAAGWGGGALGGSGGRWSGCAGGGGGGGWFGGGGGGATNCSGGGGGGGGGSNYICPCASGGSSAAGFRSGQGQVMVSWQAPTMMTAAPAEASLSGDTLSLSSLSATLTGPNGPIAGQPVTFSAGSSQLCTATTNAQGTATCGTSVADGAASMRTVLQSLGYTATYAGDPAYQPIATAGGLASGDCGCGDQDAVLRERAKDVVHRTATQVAAPRELGRIVL